MSAFDGSRSYWNVKIQCVAQVLKAVWNILICVKCCNFLLNAAIDHDAYFSQIASLYGISTSSVTYRWVSSFAFIITGRVQVVRTSGRQRSSECI